MLYLFLLILRVALLTPELHHLTSEVLLWGSTHPPIVFYFSNLSAFSPIFCKWFHHIISLCNNPQNSLLRPAPTLPALSLALFTRPSCSALTGHRTKLDSSLSSKLCPTLSSHSSCYLPVSSQSRQASPFLQGLGHLHNCFSNHPHLRQLCSLYCNHAQHL